MPDHVSCPDSIIVVVCCHVLVLAMLEWHLRRVQTVLDMQDHLKEAYLTYLLGKRKRNTRFNRAFLSRLRSNFDDVLAIGDDSVYVSLFMVTRHTFHEILLPPFRAEYNSRAVRRRVRGSDRNAAKFVRLDMRNMSAKMTLALVLSHLVGNPDTRMRQLVHAQCEETLTRYLKFGVECLNAAWCRIPSSRVSLPTLGEMQYLSSLVERRVGGADGGVLNGTFGFIDGSMHTAQKPTCSFKEREYYNGYYGCNGFKAVYLVAADGTIRWAKLCPGTAYDNTVYESLALELHDRIPHTLPYKILGDSAFSITRVLVRPYTSREIAAHPGRDAEIRSHNKKNKQH
mmetsp:Transcript_27051/g.43732  ORF Transcript_27051/g.43732 Transcript_27051/m.43732 type:complete len:342 (+) Transcript_27051:731-1756(+)